MGKKRTSNAEKIVKLINGAHIESVWGDLIFTQDEFETLIDLMNKESKRKFAKMVRGMMKDAVPNATSHYDAERLGVTEDQVTPGYDFDQLVYEALSYTAQQENEGIMWGWQDCIKAVLKKINKKL